MDNKLIDESLKEECSFSSKIQAIDTITKDCGNVSSQDYPIPKKYNKSKLVLMAVNKTRFYFYWEFTDHFLAKNIVDIKDMTFHIVDQSHNLLDVVDCTNNIGQYFYTNKKDIQSLQIVAVYKHGIQYKNLLESNIVKVLNDTIKFKKDDVMINKQKGFTEVIRASISHFTIGISSKSYVDEIERLKEYEKISKESFSSYDIKGR